ncbi:substrate-binding periplasmic protein [Thalassospira marina]|uniref:Amino acid-binding protein n=1 Tax=Thalassospira marina TaxID=2048283 RepID=A0ABM6QG88_9PROT|nr:transporter substrate-binding domain-containing protein [Thalassospira marina]AUG55588.1 amino acid-binding protein [Thalassospira marina]
MGKKWGVAVLVLLAGGLSVSSTSNARVLQTQPGLNGSLANKASISSPFESANASATCTKLHITGAAGWEPISYQDKNGVAHGVSVDILREFTSSRGLELDVNLDIPWNRGMLMLASGEIDAMAGAYFTEERDREFTYSQPYASDDIMVFQSAKRPFLVDHVRDLIDRRGARPQGGSYGDFLDHYAEDYLDIIFSPTGNRILDLLTSNRVDYVMLGRFDGMANIINDNIGDQIRMVEKPLMQNPVMFMFSKKSPCRDLVPELDAFIEQLEQNGQLATMTQAHLPKPDAQTAPAPTPE